MEEAKIRGEIPESRIRKGKARVKVTCKREIQKIRGTTINERR